MKYLLTLCLCLNLSAAFSQDTKDQAIDFFGCRIIESTLNNEERHNFTTQFDCNHNPNVKAIKEFLSGKDKSLALFNEIQSLRNASEMNNHSAKFNVFLTDKVFKENGKYQLINSFYVNHHNDPAFTQAIKDIKSNLSYEVTSVDDSTSQPAKPSPTNSTVKPALYDSIQDTPSEKDQMSEKSGFGGVTFEVDVIAITLTMLCFLGLLLLRPGKPSISDDIRDYVKKKISEQAFNPPNNKAELHEKLEAVRRELHILKQEISDLRGRNTSSYISREINPAPVDYSPTAIPVVQPTEPQPEVYYLPTPNADGSFMVNTLSPTYREGASIYKMMRHGINQASFQIDEHETSIRLALQYAELRIEPCCTALNAFTAATKNIALKSSGTLELQVDKWVVTTKATIFYEN